MVETLESYRRYLGSEVTHWDLWVRNIYTYLQIWEKSYDDGITEQLPVYNSVCVCERERAREDSLVFWTYMCCGRGGLVEALITFRPSLKTCPEGQRHFWRWILTTVLQLVKQHWEKRETIQECWSAHKFNRRRQMINYFLMPFKQEKIFWKQRACVKIYFKNISSHFS